MAKQDIYTIKQSALGPNIYDVMKMSKDYEPGGIYHIAVAPNKTMSCTCYAGHKFCRHKKMFLEFRNADRIGSGWSYSFDSNKWFPPLAAEEV